MTAPATAPSQRSSVEACVFSQRAMLIWPRLDRRVLARCGHDPRRIAAYVARRTSLPVETITAILEDGGRAEHGPTLSLG